MVSILPSERTPWDVIGKQINQNISQNLPGAVKQGYERQLGMNALDQAQSDIDAANGDPFKIAMAFARATTQNKNLERAAGPLFQTALSQSQRKRGLEDFQSKGGKTTAGGMPVGEKEVPISVSDLVPPNSSSVSDPQATGKFQLPYTEQDISNIRNKARQNGYTPEMEERFVNDAVEINKIAENRRNVEIGNYNQEQQERRDTLENQNAFTKYLQQNAPEFTNNPDELALALKAAEKYQKGSPSFADRLAKVREEIRPYQAEKASLKKTLNRPLFGMSKDRLALAQPRAQRLVEMGQKPQLQLMIANGGQGENEEALLLNPLPEKFENDLGKFGKLYDPLKSVTEIDPDSEKYNEQIQQGQKKRLKQQDLLSDFLSEKIESGTYEKPGTNLLLTRKHLTDKGATWSEAGKIIDKAISKGNIKLDPQQKIDNMKLSYPPLEGDAYLDTIMNHLIFPLTGKE